MKETQLTPKKKFKYNRKKNFVSFPSIPTLSNTLHLLEKVQITDCQLRSIPTEILLHCYNIKFLDLSRNQLSTWPNDFYSVKFRLNFDSQALTFSKSLLKLNLSENMYSNIPDDFWRLSKLKHFTFQHNQLSVFPLVLCKMPTLVTINMSFNTITGIPAQISHLPCKFVKSSSDILVLEKLELRGNGPAALPCELANLKALKRLSIQCYK